MKLTCGGCNQPAGHLGRLPSGPQPGWLPSGVPPGARPERREFLADAADPRRAFAFFTFTGASDVLAARLAGDGHTAAAVVLLAAGGAGWVLLSYSVPLQPAGRPGMAPALAGANGTWFIWVVGTQSIAVAAASPHKPLPEGLAALATCCWAVGVVLYLLVAVMVAVALMQYPVQPAEPTPPYWAPPCMAWSPACRWCCGRSGPG